MSKHTPGPWSRNKYGSVIGPDGKDVLFRAVSTLCSGADEKMAMAEANTDLAASAPELLEALGSLLAVYSEPDQRICCSGFGCGCMGATTYQQAEYYARAAIAKAKGESA